MILTHAKDITRAYGGVPVRDAVLVVPAFYTQPERQALMDAAEIADIKVRCGAVGMARACGSCWVVDRRVPQLILHPPCINQQVLGLMDENAAAALLFAVDNVYEEPTNIVFYNLGASSLQVARRLARLLLVRPPWTFLDSPLPPKPKPIESGVAGGDVVVDHGVGEEREALRLLHR